MKNKLKSFLRKCLDIILWPITWVIVKIIQKLVEDN